jgi:hypothetical protein
MNCYELAKLLRVHFPKAYLNMFLDPHLYVHYFPDIQFVDSKGCIIPPWNSDNTAFCFIDDLPFFRLPVSCIKVWTYPNDTHLTVCVDIDGIQYEGMPIFLDSPPFATRSILEKIDVPKLYQAVSVCKEV